MAALNRGPRSRLLESPDRPRGRSDAGGVLRRSAPSFGAGANCTASRRVPAPAGHVSPGRGLDPFLPLAIPAARCVVPADQAEGARLEAGGRTARSCSCLRSTASSLIGGLRVHADEGRADRARAEDPSPASLRVTSRSVFDGAPAALRSPRLGGGRSPLETPSAPAPRRVGHRRVSRATPRSPRRRRAPAVRPPPDEAAGICPATPASG